jgi:ATP-dependent DNA helicase RecG
MEALREALANATCHRDYGLGGGSVGVAIYDNRLEITNSGTLPPGITIDQLTEPHTSQIRNDLIADTFYRRGIIEQWGRGTVRMVELTEEAGLVPPEFEERGGEIVVRFRPTRYVAPRRVEHDLSDLQQELLQIVGREGPVSLSDVKAYLAKDAAERTVQENLQTLRDLDLLRLEGHGRGARWRLRENGRMSAVKILDEFRDLEKHAEKDAKRRGHDAGRNPDSAPRTSG